MSFVARLCFVAVVCVAVCGAADLILGSTVNTTIVYTENVKLNSIPLTTRTKNVFYNTNSTARLIKGIAAIDLGKSKAEAIVTSGGIGSTYTNVRIKSTRGNGLNYVVQIFV